MDHSAQDGSRRFRDAGLFMLAWVFWLLLIIAFEYVLKDLRPSLTVAYLISGALELLLLMPAAAYVQIKKLRLADIFGRTRASQVIAGAFAGLLLAPATMWLTLLWNLLIRLTGGSLTVSPAFPVPQTAIQFIAGFFAIGLSAPIVEEPVMRGLALDASGRAMGRAKAFLLVSVLFTLAHGRFLGLPAIFAAALLLAFLAWRSGSLWPAIAAHASFNTLTLILNTAFGYLARRGIMASMESVSNAQYLAATLMYFLVALPFIGALIAILWAFRRYTPKSGRPAAAPSGAPFSSLWPWLVSVVLLAGYVVIDVMRIYGIIGSAN